MVKIANIKLLLLCVIPMGIMAFGSDTGPASHSEVRASTADAISTAPVQIGTADRATTTSSAASLLSADLRAPASNGKNLLVPHSNIEPGLRSLLINNGPEQLQKIERKMKNIDLFIQHSRGQLNNKYIFTGPPGEGKTTTSEALCQNADVDYEIILGSALADTFKNSGAQNVLTIFDYMHNRAIKTNKVQVLIIDEIDAVTDGFKKSVNHDTNFTQAFWQSLDLLSKNPKFFFIGTTNYADEQPVQITSRFGQHNIIKFEAPGIEKRISVIGYHLGDRHTLTDKEIRKLAHRMDGYCSREIALAISNVSESAISKSINEIIEGTRDRNAPINVTSYDIKTANIKPAWTYVGIVLANKNIVIVPCVWLLKTTYPSLASAFIGHAAYLLQKEDQNNEYKTRRDDERSYASLVRIAEHEYQEGVRKAERAENKKERDDTIKAEDERYKARLAEARAQEPNFLVTSSKKFVESAVSGAGTTAGIAGATAVGVYILKQITNDPAGTATVATSATAVSAPIIATAATGALTIAKTTILYGAGAVAATGTAPVLIVGGAIAATGGTVYYYRSSIKNGAVWVKGKIWG